MQKKILALAVLGVFCGSSAFAAAYQTYEQSATTMGQANAGTGVTTDPSIQYWNPAGMSFVDQTELGISATLVNSQLNFFPSQATGFSGEPVTGSTEGPGVDSYVPAFYFITPINPKLTFGFGTEVPFGFETEYPDNSVARYFAVESKITSVNINPALAYQLTPKISMGGGLIVNFTEAQLSQMIDSQGILNFPPFLPPLHDALFFNSAKSWDLGWDAGLEVKPYDTTAIGLSYHSQMKQDLEGTATLHGDAFTLQQLFTLAGLQDSELTTRLTLPGYTTLSASQQLTSKWTVMSDVEYIQWNALKDVTLNFVGKTIPTVSSQIIPFDYHDTWRVALGQSYQIRPDLLLRMGIAYDESPIPNSLVRTARLADNDRYWAALGATYNINSKSDISFGYAHVFIKDSTVNNTNGLQTLVANYSGGADLFGLQYNLSFS